ncbi:hypothetical protein CMU19_04265 [Elizabethkingia anophelis]|nr:hypothetical protein [Elizabethkingia anophelis]
MKELFKSLAGFQQEVPVILKDSKGYGYDYSSLPHILEVINPLLKKHGLGYSQPLKGKSINTILYHVETGESIESEVDIPQGVELKGMNDFQVLGSAISYLRRYSLASILGLVTDKDIDAAGEQVNKGKKQNSGSKSEDKAWLNLTNKEGNPTSIFTKIIERSKTENITVEGLKEHYKISNDGIKLLKENGIL